MILDLRPASRRYTDVRIDGVTDHSFSFGHHYDPANLTFGPMRAFDDHRLTRGAGFEEHRHSGVELVTWVAEGTVVHADDAGNVERLPAGTVAVQSAGSGIRHAEHGDDSEAPTRFLQTWLVSDEPDAVPTRTVASGVDGDELRPVAGEGASVPVGVRGATLWFGRPRLDAATALPVRAAHHLFVVSGSVRLTTPQGEIDLAAGDAVRAREADAVALELVSASPGSEVLLWTFASA